MSTQQKIYRGYVQEWSDSKGYGWLRSPQHFGPIFGHYTAIVGQGFQVLAPEQEVEFGLIDGPKGLQAWNIRKLVQRETA